MPETDVVDVQSAAVPAPLEVVESRPAEVPHENHAGSAIDRAAEAALMMPGIPGRDEFLTLAMTAKMLSMSGAAPPAVRNNPHVAFHVAMVGRDLGISPSAAMNLIDIIPTQNGPTITLSPQLLSAQVKRLKLGTLKPVIQTPERAVYVAILPGGDVDLRCMKTFPDHHDECRCHGIEGFTEFTWDDAIAAGLADKRCRARDHVTSCTCKQNWRTYSQRMVSWRAAGYCADDFFPEASVGLYTPEELGAVVDDDGRALDPATVAIPDGYEKALPPGDKPAAASLVWELELRVRALPANAAAELRDRWGNLDKLNGIHPTIQGLRSLTDAQYRLVLSLLKGVEAAAKKADGHDPVVAVESLCSTVAANLISLLVPGRFVTPEPHHDDDKPGEASSDPTPAPEAPRASQEEIPDGDRAASVMDMVRALGAKEVAQALDARGLPTDGGEIQEMRKRLALAILRENTKTIEGK